MSRRLVINFEYTVSTRKAFEQSLISRKPVRAPSGGREALKLFAAQRWVIDELDFVRDPASQLFTEICATMHAVEPDPVLFTKTKRYRQQRERCIGSVAFFIPWDNAQFSDRIEALEMAYKIVFCDKTAVRREANGWKFDLDRMEELSGETEAEKFISAINLASLGAMRDLF